MPKIILPHRVRMKEEMRERVTEREALCLGKAVSDVPWGFGAISCPYKQ